MLNSTAISSNNNEQPFPSSLSSSSNPPSIGGQMDGEREPRNKLEFVMNKVSPYKESLSKQIKPWKEFGYIGIPDFNNPNQIRLDIMVKKVQYFQGNYLLIMLILLSVNLLRNFHALIAFTVLGAVWSYFSVKNEDITWKPMINGKEINKQQRTYIVWGLTIMVFIWFGLDILFSVLGIGAVFVGVHAILCHHNASAIQSAEESHAVLDQI
jgi:PRA1 family protein